MDLVDLREFISKWLMRSQNAGTVLRIPLLGVTAVSTFVTALRGTFLESYTLIMVGLAGLAGVAFIWAYDRFQVMNLQSKWDADRSDNYFGPSGAMQQIAAAERQAVLAQSIQEGWSMEKTRSEMRKAVEQAISENRDGIDMRRFDE